MSEGICNLIKEGIKTSGKISKEQYIEWTKRIFTGNVSSEGKRHFWAEIPFLSSLNDTEFCALLNYVILHCGQGTSDYAHKRYTEITSK